MDFSNITLALAHPSERNERFELFIIRLMSFYYSVSAVLLIDMSANV